MPRVNGGWAFSTDGENFHVGYCGSREAAVKRLGPDGGWVGYCRKPLKPCECVDDDLAARVLGQIAAHNDFQFDFVQDLLGSVTDEQRAALQQSLRRAVRGWFRETCKLPKYSVIDRTTIQWVEPSK